MIRNYLKIAFRNLTKNKVYAFINIIGLSVAFGTAMLLFLTAHFELSFDDFQINKDRVFKTYYKINYANKIEYGNSMSIPFLPALLAEYKSEIKSATRILDGSVQVIQGEKTINESINYVDADFLKVFSFKVLKGNPNTALNDLKSIVLNDEIAKKIFGEVEPIGKLVRLNFGGRFEDYTVTAITKKAPDNSSIENEMMIRFENHSEYQQNKDRWNMNTHSVHVLLADNIDAEAFEKRMKSFTGKYYKNEIEQLKKEGAKPDDRGELISLRLLPLPEEHFNKQVNGNAASDKSYPYILLIVSGLILLIACVNFVNLSIARSLSRAKEVGMRKALGAVKSQIVGQFWGEALILCSVAFGLGCVLATLAMPQYNAIFRSKLLLNNLLQPNILALLAVGFLFVTLVAGGYPAWVVAKFNTIEVLKGKLRMSGSAGGLRSGLIITQFSIAVFLISCTLILWKQIDYLRNKPLGFDKEQVISIPVGYEVSGYKVLDFMRNKLANQPQILSITGSDINIGKGNDGASYKSVFGFNMEGKTYSTNGLNIDFDYTKTLGIKLISGRDFSKAFPADKARNIIINESMAKQLGFKNPTVAIGRTIPLGDSLGKTIVGVVKDYHFESLKNKIVAITYFMRNDFGIGYIFVKVSPNSSAKTMAILEKAYKEIAPKSEFKGSFLDENTNNQYEKEERFGKMILSAATLAILLCCMGLFAIALITMAQRTKEIGIRKVLGASVLSITTLLTKDFLKLVLVAILVASPVAWWAMNKWLADFVYRIEISWLMFVVTAILAISIATLTVGFQAIKTALMNPVKSLKSE